MQTEFFDPPFPGSYVLKKDAEDEGERRRCLVMGFDDHSILYIVADWETGAQTLLGFDDLLIDCDGAMRAFRDEPLERGPRCVMCGQATPLVKEDED